MEEFEERVRMCAERAGVMEWWEGDRGRLKGYTLEVLRLYAAEIEEAVMVVYGGRVN
jgi:hypothetical protein